MRYVEIPNEERHWQPHIVCFDNHLRSCIKDNCAADIGERLNNYRAFLSFATLPIICSGYRDDRFTNIYWDAPRGIVLAYKYFVNDRAEYRGIACIGFNINESTVHIRQIQGARYRHEELAPLRWEKLLVKVVIEIAQRLEFKMVEILPAKKNEWLNLGNASQLKLRYDVTAKRIGFKWNPQKQVYEYSL